jgi:hypothetical protein
MDKVLGRQAKRIKYYSKELPGTIAAERHPVFVT